MGMLIRKQRGYFRFTRIGKLSLVGLIISFAAAFISTIWAVYMDSFINDIVLVGLFSSLLTLISFFSYFFIIPYIEKADKGKIFSLSLILFIISYILFAINNNFYLFLILAVAITIILTLRMTSFGILVRDNSRNRDVSVNEGIIYTFMNIAYVLGPLIAGFILSGLGISWVFILSALFLIFGLIIFQTSKIQDTEGKKKIDKKIAKNFIDFFKSKERTIAYLIGAGVNVWWTLTYLFIPLMIVRSNLGEIWIGYFLFATAIPLMLFEYVFSKWASKNGFKKMFKTGYLIVAVLSFACFFFSNIYVILGLLVLASIGIAMIEPTSEAYFFDILKGKEKYRFYAPYNTSANNGGLVGRILGSILLIFLPFKFIFLLFAILMFVLFLISRKTKAVNESKRK